MRGTGEAINTKCLKFFIIFTKVSVTKVVKNKETHLGTKVDPIKKKMEFLKEIIETFTSGPLILNRVK